MTGVSFLLTNARMVSKGNDLGKAEILVEGERIAGVGAEDSFSCGNKVDAGGLLVLPGLIDPHVHFRDSGVPSASQKLKEDFSTGSKAALAGGVTTVLDMPNTVPPTTTLEAYKTKRDNASETSFCDFGIYAGAATDNIPQLQTMVEGGAIAVKMYMASTTGNLLVADAATQEKVFASAHNFLLALHAEDEDCIKWHAKYYEDKKFAYHTEVRPAECAKKALERVLEFTRRYGNRSYVCHVSTAEEAKLIAEAKKEGLQVFMEVTPHHLFFNKVEEDNQGNRVRINPPLRTKADNAALWEALNNGIVDAIGTDHSPHLLEEKRRPYWEAPKGFPGVETRLPLLVTAALDGKTTFETIQRTCCENPAKMFGLKGKGFLSEGCDADLVFVDLVEERVVRDEDMHSRCGWTPYAGKTLRGWPSKVYLRGRKVFDNGVFEGPYGKEVRKNG